MMWDIPGLAAELLNTGLWGTGYGQGWPEWGRLLCNQMLEGVG